MFALVFIYMQTMKATLCRFAVSSDPLVLAYKQTFTISRNGSNMCVNIILIYFHILVLPEYWVLIESRIRLKPVLGACELLHFPLVLMNRLNITKSPLF